MKATLKTLFKFGAAGILSLVLNLLFTMFFVEILRIDPRFANAIALGLLIVWNFFIAKFVVFKGTGPQRSSATAHLSQFAQFILSSFAFRFMEYGLYLLFYTQVHLAYQLCVLLASIISFFVKFVFYRCYLFRANYASRE